MVCCAGSACRCCCASLPSINSSLSTRISYLCILISGVITSAILMAPEVGKALAKFNSFCQSALLYVPTQPTSSCDNVDMAMFAGFAAVYRVCFGLAVFFFLFMIIMIRVRSSSDPRSAVQNGFWFFKWLIIIGTIIGAFFIHDKGFEMGMMVVGVIGGFIFYIIMMITVVDFSYKWTESWNERYENSGQGCWFFGVIFFSIIFYACFIALVVVLYIYYAYPSCTLHQFFVSFNLILCILVSVVSILPKIKKYNPRSGLLQSSIVSFYIMYVTWTSMTSSPTCNPLSTCGHHNNSATVTAASMHFTKDCMLNTFSYDVIIPLVLLLVVIIYTGFSKVSNDAIDTVRGAPTEETQEDGSADKLESQGGQEVIDDEENNTTYSYSFFHLVFLTATLFLMMTLTHWLTPNATGNANAAVWVKISASWLSLLIYLWILIAPLLLKDRVFD